MTSRKTSFIMKPWTLLSPFSPISAPRPLRGLHEGRHSPDQPESHHRGRHPRDQPAGHFPWGVRFAPVPAVVPTQDRLCRGSRPGRRHTSPHSGGPLQRPVRPAPDNGLLTLLHRDGSLQGIRSVENPQYFAAQVSRTFHGRDVFGPSAAHLSKGLSIDVLGPAVDRMEVSVCPDPSSIPTAPSTAKSSWSITSGTWSPTSGSPTSRRHTLRHHRQVVVGERVIGPLHVSYAEVPSGQPLALLGSTSPRSRHQWGRCRRGEWESPTGNPFCCVDRAVGEQPARS